MKYIYTAFLFLVCGFTFAQIDEQAPPNGEVLEATQLIDEQARSASNITVTFTSNNQRGCELPHVVSFTPFVNPPDTSYTYSWDFGDGVTSTQEQPTHTYMAEGDYTVTLQVSNSTGASGFDVKFNYIQILVPDANFVVSDTFTCLNSPVTFANLSLSVNHQWNFGDGSVSNDPNPTHTYTSPGSYDVGLIVTVSSLFGGCSDTLARPALVDVVPLPTAAFQSIPESPVTSCEPPLFVLFFDNSLGAASYQWSFGDGNVSSSPFPAHIYALPGIYDLSYTITDFNGCQDEIYIPEFARITSPSPNFQVDIFEGCKPLTVQFSNTSNPIGSLIDSLAWDFGDGTTVSNDTAPIHVFQDTGRFNVSLYVQLRNSCQTIYSLNSAVQVGDQPIADFSAEVQEASPGDTIWFNEECSNIGSEPFWFWYFGDGLISDFPNPYHIYQDTGVYDVSIVVNNYGCTDSLSKPDYIEITPDCGKDIFEPNNTIFESKELPMVGINKNATICGDGDEDWYFYKLMDSDNFAVSLNGMDVDLDLELYDENFNLLASSVQVGLGEEGLIQNSMVVGGLYYIRVFSQSATGGSSSVSSPNGYNLHILERDIPFSSTATPIKATNSTRDEEEALPFILEEDLADFTLYPNPASSQVKLSFGLEEDTPFTVRIVDLYGRSLITGADRGESGNNDFVMDIESLTNGMYFVLFQTPNHKEVKRLEVIR